MALRQKDDKEARFDPNPIFACRVVYDEETKIGHIVHDVAFDPKYGPDSQHQIDWHREMETPGAETWEVGVPCDLPGFRTKKRQEEEPAVA